MLEVPILQASIMLTQLGHLRCNISPNVASRLSLQATNASSQGDLVIDGGTNISLMGKHFHIIGSTGCYVDMEGFTTGVSKSHVKLKSGFALCTSSDGS